MAVTLEEAKQLVVAVLLTNKNYSESHTIDTDRIEDYGCAWIIYIKRTLPTQFHIGGEFTCYLVGKDEGDVLEIAESRVKVHVAGYQMGLRYGKSNLIITKINDYEKTVAQLLFLELTFVIPEEEAGIVWKIAQRFTREMIIEKLNNLPCIFYEQTLLAYIQTFLEVSVEQTFEFEIQEIPEDQPKYLI